MEFVPELWVSQNLFQTSSFHRVCCRIQIFREELFKSSGFQVVCYRVQVFREGGWMKCILVEKDSFSVDSLDNI